MNELNNSAATGALVGASTPVAAEQSTDKEMLQMQTHPATKPGRVQIGDVDLEQVFYKGQPVATFAQIDQAHKRPEGTAKRNFYENHDRFAEGSDFALVPASLRDEFRTFGIEVPNRGLMVITRRGYLKLTKSLGDDLAWSVFDDMIERYFAAERQLAVPNFADPAAAARAWADQFEARQIAERTKAEIGSRREATAMNTASQAVKKANELEIELGRSKQYAAIKLMEAHYKGQSFSYHLLKRYSAILGIEVKTTFDPNFGKVNTYHADVWAAAYGLEIPTMEIH